MQHIYTRLLNDEELLQHLRSDDQVVLRIEGIRWQEIERQVERLGFGDRFFVSATKGKRGESCRIEPASWMASVPKSAIAQTLPG